MIFENGECVMTYQSDKAFTDEEKESMLTRFNAVKSDEIYYIVMTQSTVNLLYYPTNIMERLSVVDPSEIVIEKLVEVVGVK